MIHMEDVTVRELRHRGGAVVRRVEAGESLTVTRDGDPVAELVPLPRVPLSSGELRRRWSALPSVDPQRLRDDIDATMDHTL